MNRWTRIAPWIRCPLVSIAYIGLGDKEKALVFLEKAYEEHSSGLTALKVDPTYDPLRREPRFQALVQHIGLAQ